MDEKTLAERNREASPEPPRQRQTIFSGTKDTYPTGATRDQAIGKGRYDLVSYFGLKRLAQVYERGAANHGDNNWKKGIPFSRLYSSAMRHLQQACQGLLDEDHLAQAAWNIFALMEFEDTQRVELDDRNEETK